MSPLLKMATRAGHGKSTINFSVSVMNREVQPSGIRRGLISLRR
jgi:hypothetical protein